MDSIHISKINIETEYCNPPECKTFNETNRQIYLSWNQTPSDWPEPVLQGFSSIETTATNTRDGERINLTDAFGIKKIEGMYNINDDGRNFILFS